MGRVLVVGTRGGAARERHSLKYTLRFSAAWREACAGVLGLILIGGCARTERPARMAPAVVTMDGETPVVRVGGGEVVVHFDETQGTLPISREAAVGWVRWTSGAVANYFGRYPVKRVDVTIRPRRRWGEINGQTHAGRTINIQVGRNVTDAKLKDDWVLTHEQFHLGFPRVPDGFEWMGEGLSTYLEPIARARVGNQTPEEMWAGVVEGSPQGVAKEGGSGLNGAHGIGRVYWGGMLFWLESDVAIRERTGGRKALDDALRAILDAGGDGSQMWEVERILTVGDRATGTRALHEMYEKYAVNPGVVDLKELWGRLGVVNHGGRVTFDDAAPLAGVRRAMTSATGKSAD